VSYSNDVASVALSSVYKAHFITARAISMKLGVRIPMGNMPRAFFDFRNLTYLGPSGGHLENQIFAIYFKS
jgi:hypothetical protein